MKYEKKVIKNLNKCYSVAPIVCGGETRIAVASEKQSPCYLFDLNGTYIESVWEEPGGVMSMVQLNDEDERFLAVERFYSFNDAEDAGIIYCKRTSEGWKRNQVASIPYVHRFDVLERGGQRYLIACTVKSGQNYPDDWSFPGKISGAVISGDLADYHKENQLKLDVIMEGLTKNHGYYRLDKSSALVSAEEGVFHVSAPANAESTWEIMQLLDIPASDAALIDFDGNGNGELVVITPFHGDQIEIYRHDGKSFCKVYEHPEKLPFLHAIYAFNRNGRQSVLLGNREGRRDLFVLYKENDQYCVEEIDSGCGPANVYSFSRPNGEVIFAANRETDEIAMYVACHS